MRCATKGRYSPMLAFAISLAVSSQVRVQTSRVGSAGDEGQAVLRTAVCSSSSSLS